MAGVCSVCGANLSEEPAILTIAGFGRPRYLCDKCAELIDKSLYSDDYDEIAEAADELALRFETRGCEDEVVLDELEDIFKRAKERAELIKNGLYDFANDEISEEEEIPDEYRELEADRKLDEKEAEANSKYDKVISWICGGVFAAVLIYFVLKFVFGIF